MVNISNFRLKIDTKDTFRVLKKLGKFKDEIEMSTTEIIKEMAEYVENETRINLENTSYKDGNDDATAYSLFYSEDGSAEAGMQGTQVLYDEFGTGTKGAESPHPVKNNFELNGYNTGPRIKTNKRGELYWTYKNENGDIVHTQGIPAGKQVFDANEKLKQSKREMIKKKVGEVISKL